MPKIRVTHQEWYPVATPEQPDGFYGETVVDVPQDLIDRWRAAKAAFDEVEDELDAYYKPIDWSKTAIGAGVPTYSVYTTFDVQDSGVSS